jgi:hypothetical protein
MSPHYSPGRFLMAISLVLGLWAMLPVAAILTGRWVYVSIFADPAQEARRRT